MSFERLFARQMNMSDGTNAFEALDWVVVGGESGSSARPMHPEWAQSLRDQCASAGVPLFFKQWGGVAKDKGGRVLAGMEVKAWPIAA